MGVLPGAIQREEATAFRLCDRPIPRSYVQGRWPRRKPKSFVQAINPLNCGLAQKRKKEKKERTEKENKI